MKTTKALCVATFLMCLVSVPTFITLALYTGIYNIAYGLIGSGIIGFLALCGVEDVESRK